MKTIYKYQFEIKEEFEIEMPAGSVILSCQLQNKTPCFWAIVDTDMQLRTRKFIIYGTGYSIEENIQNLSYLSTIQIGAYVYHIFESFDL